MLCRTADSKRENSAVTRGRVTRNSTPLRIPFTVFDFCLLSSIVTTVVPVHHRFISIRFPSVDLVRFIPCPSSPLFLRLATSFQHLPNEQIDFFLARLLQHTSDALKSSDR